MIEINIIKIKVIRYCDQALNNSDRSEQNQCDQDECDHDDELYILFI